MRIRAAFNLAGKAFSTFAGELLGTTARSNAAIRTAARRDESDQHCPADDLAEPASRHREPLPFASSLLRRGADGSDDLTTLAYGTTDSHQHIFVAVAEIERFAVLRQRVGYTLANELVGAFTARLRSELSGCQVGRVGRTTVEFAFAADSFNDALTKLGQLVKRLEQPFDLQQNSFNLFVTIGTADAGHNAIDDRLLDLAESALAEAHRRHVKFWIAETGSESLAEFDYVAVLRDLRTAMDNGDLSLYYQPKLCAKTDTVTSCEALLRWHHQIHGLLRTDRLIEAAEVTGAIRDITYWVIERAIADQAAMKLRGRDIEIFVNISGIMLPERTFATWALAQVERATGRIGFEITETAVIKDPADAIANLQLFADACIKIAIDDYGSGLSSLAYLKQLPAHELKIDRMFVSGLTESHRDPLLVRSTIDLAHALEMHVTAEGVDNPMSLALLRIMGCDLLQGHVISPPLPLDEFEAFLSAHSPAGLPRPTAWNVDGWTAEAAKELRFG